MGRSTVGRGLGLDAVIHENFRDEIFGDVSMRSSGDGKVMLPVQGGWKV